MDAEKPVKRTILPPAGREEMMRNTITRDPYTGKPITEKIPPLPGWHGKNRGPRQKQAGRQGQITRWRERYGWERE